MQLADFLGLLAGLAYFSGSVVCHQIAERSFMTAGRQWPVCARCSGIYLGVAVGFAGWLIVRRFVARRPVAASSLKVLAIVAAPTALSLISGVLGIWDGTNAIRFALAAPFGIVAGGIVAAVASKDLR